MNSILPSDVAEVIGNPDPLIRQEIVQTRASLEEWKLALALSGDFAMGAVRRTEGLSNRVLRLIDLLSVADRGEVGRGQTFPAPSLDRVHSAGSWSGEK